MKKVIYTLLPLLLVLSLLLFCLPSGCCWLQEERPAPPPQGGTLNLYNIDPHTLDPAISSDMTSHSYIVQLFSGLLRLDDNLEPVADIAQRWQISDDGKTYTFYLRDDARFHDGRQVTADDFKYSWERACSPQTGSQTAATYLGDIVGVKAVLEGKAEEISGVTVIDDHTLRVTIDAPKAYFLSKLTYATAFVVDENNIQQGKDWWRQPNGSGPFKLNEWQEQSRLVLERNELYYGEMADVDSVIFHLWAGLPMNLYETGKIDVTGVSLSYIERASDPQGPFADQLTTTPELSFYYIGFNTRKPPFDDANIRRAFSHAIDKERLAFLVFKDMLSPAGGILPPGMPGYNEDIVGLEFDLDRAKELIASSSYGDASSLPPITITTMGWGGLISPDLEAIVHEWRQNLGVEVTVRQLEPERFLYHLKEEKDEMFFMGWIADYPHPQDFLEILFSSDSENNYGEYSNSAVDAWLQEAAIEPDREASLALY
ncbi:MAG: peptide ABC transporter substrate-binding protein, partial [Dehalococcoidia bacterium]